MDSNGNPLLDSAESWAMIKDNVTGLIWENKTDDGSIYTFDNAQSVYIKNLNDNKFGGVSDWRMPTIKELASTVKLGRYSPAIDFDYFNNIVNQITKISFQNTIQETQFVFQAIP